MLKPSLPICDGPVEPASVFAKFWATLDGMLGEAHRQTRVPMAKAATLIEEITQASTTAASVGMATHAKA